LLGESLESTGISQYELLEILEWLEEGAYIGEGCWCAVCRFVRENPEVITKWHEDGSWRAILNKKGDELLMREKALEALK